MRFQRMQILKTTPEILYRTPTVLTAPWKAGVYSRRQRRQEHERVRASRARVSPLPMGGEAPNFGPNKPSPDLGGGVPRPPYGAGAAPT